MKLMIVFGTRPEAIKLAPVIQLARHDSNIDLIVCSTGQHRQMLDQALSVFNIQPDIDLNVMVKNQTLSILTSNLITRLAKCFEDHKPDIVMVQGDTTTAFVACLAAFYAKILVAHVEAGLRTRNLSSPFPEEFNRISISRIATLHFAPTIKAKANLLSEGINPNSVYVVGNTIIDALKAIAGTEERLGELQKSASIIPKRDFILVTTHRRENLAVGVRRLCQAIKQLASDYPEFDFIFPAHLNPNVRMVLNSEFKGYHQIYLVEPVNFSTMLYLESSAKLIITDSGGVQEEAASFCTPVVIVREHTERGEGVEQGFAVLAGTSKDAIVRAAKECLNNHCIKKNLISKANPYGDGFAAKRILAILREQFTK